MIEKPTIRKYESSFSSRMGSINKEGYWCCTDTMSMAAESVKTLLREG